MIVMHGQHHLFQVIPARHPPRRFASGLDSRQEQRHQDANDGNDDEQLDEGESSGSWRMFHGLNVPELSGSIDHVVCHWLCQCLESQD